MIDKNDLYDITFALIIIRNDIREKSNLQVLYQIIRVLETEKCAGDNQIRKAISSIEGIARDHWSFAFYNNVYVNHQMLKKSDIYSLLIKLILSLIYELEQENFEKAYDLVDAFHCLPDIIADNNFTVPKSYWKTFVKTYRNKWDYDFLHTEQKKIK